MNALIKYAVPVAILGFGLADAAPPPGDQLPQPTVKPAEQAMKPMNDAQVLTRLDAEADRAKTLGELAADKATTAEVKKLGKDISQGARDTKARVETTAKAVGVVLKANESAMKQGLDPTIERLQGLSGIAFDKAVVNALHANRAAVADLLAESATHGNPNDVKSLASQLLPGVERHRDEAKGLMVKLTSRPS